MTLLLVSVAIVVILFLIFGNIDWERNADEVHLVARWAASPEVRGSSPLVRSMTYREGICRVCEKPWTSMPDAFEMNPCACDLRAQRDAGLEREMRLAMRLAYRAHTEVLRVGKYLWEIDRGRHYIALGYETMSEWLVAEGFDPARARRQMLMYEHCVYRTGIDLERVAELDVELLYLVRTNLTKAKAPRVLADLGQVKAGKLTRTEFLEKHRG